MAITIRMITKLVEHLDMKLVAGENGLDREVTWTHMVDSDIISVFLQGQELVFTTGIGLNEDLSLFELVKDVYHKGASGIVINIGPYVKSIDQDINGFTQSHMNNVGQTTTRYAGVHKKLYKKITFHSTIRLLKSIVKKKGDFMANKTNSLSHTKWMCKYHIVFVPKYRRKAIYAQYRQSLQDIIRLLTM